MSKRKRSRYDKAFKLMAIELYRSGKLASIITKNLGIGVEIWFDEGPENMMNQAASVFRGNGKQDLTPD